MESPANTRSIPSLLFPSVHDVLHTSLRPSGIFDRILASCLPDLAILLIRLFQAASNAHNPDAVHIAFLRIHFLPTAILRRLLRGEPGWRSPERQLQAVQSRIRRANNGEWGELWTEGIQGHHKCHERIAHRCLLPHERQHDPRFRRAQRLAADAQYGRAMRTLRQSRIADLRDPTVVDRLRDLHPAPPSPVTPLPTSDLPMPMHITDDAVLQAVRHLNPNSAPGPDRMHPRLLHLQTFTTTVAQSGITCISVLAAVLTRLARWDLPEDTIPLLSSVTLLPIQPRPCKIRPIAIGTALRGLVTKVLLPQVIADTREYLTPLQVASGFPRGLDAIVDDVRRYVDAF
eukprot:GFKZ01003695.1.p1 GENE.GFKZ01003695.1~~GFKZ01003695.1.p1  ORF type:complete len:345 (+),score=3.40 GFKZ01003695.1:241-1275(+)